MSDACVAAIKFALETDEGIPFLNAWMHGDFPEIRASWPDCPPEVFEGAEPKRGEALSFKAQALSVQCPYCEHDNLGLIADPRGMSIDCDECKESFLVPAYSTAEIL